MLLGRSESTLLSTVVLPNKVLKRRKKKRTTFIKKRKGAHLNGLWCRFFSLFLSLSLLLCQLYCLYIEGVLSIASLWLFLIFCRWSFMYASWFLFWYLRFVLSKDSVVWFKNNYSKLVICHCWMPSTQSRYCLVNKKHLIYKEIYQKNTQNI